MDRAANNDLSLPLYNYLCKKLGTEDEIKTKRLFYSIFDYTISNKYITFITSGSKGEGLDMDGSDIDVMYLNNSIHVYENQTDEMKPNSFIMLTENTRPGFVQLKFSGASIPSFALQWCNSFGSELFLSNEKLKLWWNLMSYARKRKTTFIHGPCISDLLENIDQAYCFRCTSWIQQAHQWIYRKRMWPSSELVSKISGYGVLLVPIGFKGSPNEDVEWRISFSVAEKQLIYSFTHTQLLCYALIKILLKEIINENINMKGLLCSYFLKTVIFWISEELPLSEWKPGNLVWCFMHVLKRLAYYSEYIVLPHYFIMQNNLFENRFSLKQGSYLTEVLSELCDRGIFCLIQSRTLSDFFPAEQNYRGQFSVCKQDRVFQQIKAFIRAMNNVWSFTNTGPREALTKLYALLCMYKFKFHRFLFFYILHRYCLITGQYYLGEFEFCNKLQYSKHKQYLPYLILGLQTDTASGWLYLATYYYTMKSYKLSLQVLEYVLNKFSPGKILYSPCQNIITVGPVDPFTSRYLSVRDTIRMFFVSSIVLFDMFGLNPAELKTELTFKKYAWKPPVIYAHFLRFLNFYHLRDGIRSRQALRDLKLTIRENFFISGCGQLAESYNCLAVACYMIGDLNTTISSLLKSRKLKGYDGNDVYVKYMVN